MLPKQKHGTKKHKYNIMKNENYLFNSLLNIYFKLLIQSNNPYSKKQNSKHLMGITFTDLSLMFTVFTAKSNALGLISISISKLSEAKVTDPLDGRERRVRHEGFGCVYELSSPYSPRREHTSPGWLSELDPDRRRCGSDRILILSWAFAGSGGEEEGRRRRQWMCVVLKTQRFEPRKTATAMANKAPVWHVYFSSF